MSRGLRKIPASAALITNWLKHGVSSPLDPPASMPADIEIIDMQFSRRDGGAHMLLIFVASEQFNEPEDVAAMEGSPNVPEWNPLFHRRDAGRL